MSSLDEALLRGMIFESVQLGSGLARSGRVAVVRSRVLAEHGVSREEDARQFDEYVLRVGGSLRRVHGIEGSVVWDLAQAALEGTPEQPPAPHPAEGDSRAATS